jgi:hypothetical protein
VDWGKGCVNTASFQATSTATRRTAGGALRSGTAFGSPPGRVVKTNKIRGMHRVCTRVCLRGTHVCFCLAWLSEKRSTERSKRRHTGFEPVPPAETLYEPLRRKLAQLRTKTGNEDGPGTSTLLLPGAGRGAQSMRAGKRLNFPLRARRLAEDLLKCDRHLSESAIKSTSGPVDLQDRPCGESPPREAVELVMRRWAGRSPPIPRLPIALLPAPPRGTRLPRREPDLCKAVGPSTRQLGRRGKPARSIGFVSARSCLFGRLLDEPRWPSNSRWLHSAQKISTSGLLT